jgi:hypothetical protein
MTAKNSGSIALKASTTRVDSACYRRYRLQKFRRGLKTAGWVFLQQNLQEDNYRLWNSFELFER